MAELLPTRSRTDPPAPEQQRTERALIPRRLHASTLRSKGQFDSGNHHQHHHRRHHAKDTVQSAIELKPPITFDHILRRDKKSPDSSRTGSQNQQLQQLDRNASIQQPEIIQRRVRPEDVAKAKRDNAKREEDLRESLRNVEEVGMSSTRQLDDTYYAILEKASILRSTVSSLQQLADESRRLHSSFQEDTNKLERDTKQNLDSFGNFNQQERTINKLVSKLQDSKGRTDQLNDRLESARLRIEGYEEREIVKQAKRRQRWHITWGTLLGVFTLIVAILLARNRRAVGHQLDTVGEHLVRLGDIAEDVVAPLSARLKSPPSEDPYLRSLFDEL